ncbi:hypothetical protein ADK70_38935 [Streptomyces rimosus subsp. pseudoverticillatus]|nr:hypothetical protein ADK70_38935 [Streptomyces rimosus subsp. pseudoverticillatus]
MPPVGERGLPAHVDEFEARSDAVHTVVGERPLVRAAGEADGMPSPADCREPARTSAVQNPM